MKPLMIFTVLLVTILSVEMCFGEEGKVVYKASTDLVNRDGLVYEEDSDTPFTGTAVDQWPNGQKKAEIEYLAGKRQGKESSWTEKGQKLYEGENFSGKSSGKLRMWHENGQQAAYIEMRNGKPHGKVNFWYENGQKESEGEWRDGKEISRKCWDEKGNLIDCEELPEDVIPNQPPN